MYVVCLYIQTAHAHIILQGNEIGNQVLRTPYLSFDFGLIIP